MIPIASFSEIESEFIERAHSTVWCNVATLDTRNRVRSRLLHPIWEGATGWVGTRRHSLKAKHIAHNPYISLAYIADVARQRIWELFRTSPHPLGFDFGTIFSSADDTQFGLLKLTLWRIEFGDVTAPMNKRVWIRPEAL